MTFVEPVMDRWLVQVACGALTQGLESVYGLKILPCLDWDHPLRYFSFQPVLHNWCNKGCGMCYPVCGMAHIKDPLLHIVKE